MNWGPGWPLGVMGHNNPIPKATNKIGIGQGSPNYKFIPMSQSTKVKLRQPRRAFKALKCTSKRAPSCFYWLRALKEGADIPMHAISHIYGPAHAFTGFLLLTKQTTVRWAGLKQTLFSYAPTPSRRWNMMIWVNEWVSESLIMIVPLIHST